MPNRISNSIAITGPDIDTFLEAIRGADALLDFTRIIPLSDNGNAVSALEGWGTPDNALNARLTFRGDLTIIYFETAWLPPMPVFLKLLDRFPALTLHCSWHSDGESTGSITRPLRGGQP